MSAPEHAAAAGQDIERRVPTVEDWLSRQTDVEIATTSDGSRVLRLGPSLAQKCHLLVPPGQIVQVDPNYTPVPGLVILNDAQHTYPEGKDRALTGKALALLASRAGIQFLDPVIDHMGGTGVSYTARARRRGPDGTWEYAPPGTKVVRFAQLERKIRRERAKTLSGWTNPPVGEALEEELVKAVDDAMEHIDAKTETKARSRTVRHLLNIQAKYKPGEVGSKPFLVVCWLFTPDYSSPTSGKLIAANFGESRGLLYDQLTGEVLPEPVALTAAPPLDDDEDDEDDEPGEEGGEEHDRGAVAPWSATSLSDWDSDELDLGPEPEVVQGVVDPPPPKPERGITFRGDPYAGQDIETVLEDEEGRAWICERVGRVSGEMQQRLIAWLSWAEGRPVSLADMRQLAAAARAAGSLR